MILDIQTILAKTLQKMNVQISEETYVLFQQYYEMLVSWNEKMNLTAITEPEEVAVKHFADSLSVLPFLPEKEDLKFIDIGTGAGFPGIPLQIVRKKLDLTLLDSLNKRVNFLKEVCRTLGLKAEFIHSRAEEFSRNKIFREKYDVAASRAVAQMGILCEYCLPYVKKGGLFIAMKGPGVKDELEQSKKGMEVLGGKVIQMKEFSLPDQSKRTLVVIEKVKETPKQYPRQSGKIKNNPLIDKGL